MASMFGFTDFNGNLSKWDVSNVEDMYGMFRDCASLKSLDLKGFTTEPKYGQVVDVYDIFEGCDNMEVIRVLDENLIRCVYEDEKPLVLLIFHY